MTQRTIHQIERRELRSKWFIASLFVVMIVGAVATWIGLLTFLGANSAYVTFDGLHDRYFSDTELLELNFPDLSRVSRIFTEDGVLLAELHDGRNSEPARIDEIPDTLINAVLAAEDAEFFEHQGIDFGAIVNAVKVNLTSNTQLGGSTITQQVVKQNFVGSELTIQRKITEALYAAELEERYTKDQILEFYLNSVYFGWSAYGVEAASTEYFNKDMDDLTIAEAATLAVIIRNPTLYDPRRQEDFAHGRRDDVIDAMASNDFITFEEAATAKRQPFRIQPPSDFDSPADHVVAEVRRQLLNDPEFFFLGATKEERKQSIFGCPAHDTDCEGGGGLEIYVTVDLELQNAANEILQSWLPVPGDDYDDPRGAPTGAIAMLDNHTGAVLVMSSGLPFENEQFDLAIQGRRNPGSAFKPFALTAYLESGGSLQSFWDARSPQEIECSTPCGPNGEYIWTVRNAGGGGGLMSLFQATAGSVNAVYAQLAVEVGPERIVDVAHRMGIQSELEPVYSLALGTGAVSPLEMASAFGNFATNGVHADPYLISRIESPHGEAIYEREIRTVQAIDPVIAASVRAPMESVVCCGTARRAVIEGVPQAGKTGTHQDFRDAWFVGYVPNFSTAVWVGFPDEQTPLRDVVINGEGYARVYGGTVPAPIWKEFMELVLAKYPAGVFPEVEGTELYNRRPDTEVPLVLGLEYEEAEDEIFDAHLNPEFEEVPSLEEQGTVVSTEPQAGQDLKHGATVIVRVSSGVPPVLEVPDLRGLGVGEASDVLVTLQQELGMIISLEVIYEETTNLNFVDKVIRSEPAIGQLLEHEGVLTLVIGIEAPPPPEEGDAEEEA